MNYDNNVLSFQLLDKNWQIHCPEDKATDLQKCVRYLDTKVREIASHGKIIANEKLLVMAAVNVIYDIISQQNQKDLYIDSLSSRIRELQNKLSKNHPQQSEMEL